MNSSIRIKPLPSNMEGQPRESQKEKIQRIRSQVKEGFYSQNEILRDIADALIMNPTVFENLNQRKD